MAICGRRRGLHGSRVARRRGTPPPVRAGPGLRPRPTMAVAVRPGVAMHLPGYPSSPQRFQVRPGIAMSYLDEGPRDGEVVVMVHGNPSWSYYWPTLVAGLSEPASGKGYRCIVPDHVGMGLSDKPDDAPNAIARYDYTLQSRVEDLSTLLGHL